MRYYINNNSNCWISFIYFIFIFEVMASIQDQHVYKIIGFPVELGSTW